MFPHCQSKTFPQPQSKKKSYDHDFYFHNLYSGFHGCSWEKNFFFFNLLESIRSLHSGLYLSLHGYHMRFWKVVVHQGNVNLEYLLMKTQSNLNFLIQNLEIDNAVKNIWGGNGRVVEIVIWWPEHIDFLIYILFSPLSYSSFFKVGVY